MPTKKTILYFQNHYKKLPIPFVVHFLNVSQNQLIVVNQIQIVLLLKSIKNMNQVVIVYLKGLDGINDNYKPIVYTKKSEDDNISEKFIKHLKIKHILFTENIT